MNEFGNTMLSQSQNSSGSPHIAESESDCSTLGFCWMWGFSDSALADQDAASTGEASAAEALHKLPWEAWSCFVLETGSAQASTHLWPEHALSTLHAPATTCNNNVHRVLSSAQAEP